MNNVVSLPNRALKLTLTLSDPEVLHELEKREEGSLREAFASHALRLGVLALRQASGSLDADVIRRESDQLLASVAGALSKHVGEASPIFKLLSPKQSDGLLVALTETLKRALDGQRDEVLKQFSLDRKDSALSRLTAELMTSNGKLRHDLAADLQKTSAAVETSLTLDDEGSPLARLKREILEVLSAHNVTNETFQTEVRTTLETFKTRREEAARTTTHGNAFEDVVGEFLDREAKRVGDLCEHVGATPGRLQRKFGDYVLELGPESAAPGARVVYEAKAKKRYTIKSALAEIAEARKNRDAEIGVFVFDRASAPETMDPLHRMGSDIFVVWDADDVTTDTYFKAAFLVARTLAHRAQEEAATAEADFAALDALIEDIGAHAASLDGIEKAARTIKKNGDVVLHGAESMREALERQVESLRAHVNGVRGTTKGE